MGRLNYQHLYYFWTIANEGSISGACKKLNLAQPTISGQLSVFEDAIGEKLFHREGRKLILTDTGRAVLHYADEIFALGRELTNTLEGRTAEREMRLSIGITDALPKLIAYRLIAPALQLTDSVQLFCYEDKTERLLAELSLHRFDLVLSDIPATQSTGARTFNHLLGECGVTIFGTRELAVRYRPNFPQSLDGAPFLYPTPSTALRRSLDQWFDLQGMRPNIRAEFDDSALLKTFARAGVGLFVAPVAVEMEISQRYNTEIIGRIDSVREQFYAISAQRKLKHPAVLAILENAKSKLFDVLDAPAS